MHVGGRYAGSAARGTSHLADAGYLDAGCRGERCLHRQLSASVTEQLRTRCVIYAWHLQAGPDPDACAADCRDDCECCLLGNNSNSRCFRVMVSVYCACARSACLLCAVGHPFRTLGHRSAHHMVCGKTQGGSVRVCARISVGRSLMRNGPVLVLPAVLVDCAGVVRAATRGLCLLQLARTAAARRWLPGSSCYRCFCAFGNSDGRPLRFLRCRFSCSRRRQARWPRWSLVADPPAAQWRRRPLLRRCLCSTRMNDSAAAPAPASPRAAQKQQPLPQPQGQPTST